MKDIEPEEDDLDFDQDDLDDLPDPPEPEETEETDDEIIFQGEERPY